MPSLDMNYAPALTIASPSKRVRSPFDRINRVALVSLKFNLLSAAPDMTVVCLRWLVDDLTEVFSEA